MNVSFDFSADTITLFDRTYPQDLFRDFLKDNYPLMVRRFITKSIVQASISTSQQGSVKTISATKNFFAIDWEYVYSLSLRNGYIITDFIMYLKSKQKWNSGN